MSTLRSSARIKAKSKAQNTQAQVHNRTNVVPRKATQDTQPNKRRKKGSSGGKDGKETSSQAFLKIRGVRGKLRLMTEMPLDILFETFSHLQPGDVLALTEASKSLCDILSSPSAICIWKSVGPV
jgi:hypothetical protein